MRIRKSFKRRIRRLVPAGIITLATLALAWFVLMLSRQNFFVLESKGVIAEQQRDLLLFTAALSLVVVLPVFALTFHIVRKYRVRQDGSQRAKKSDYAPDLEGNTKLETLWWTIPSAIIIVLSVITWQTSHSLDPYKPLAAKQDQMTIEVVALQWKWLFIYPDENVASVNELKLPVGKPVNFRITSDAPMNAFWIPQLGGQVYAMSGMTSQLHLQADEAGTYRGVSSNISGEGFAKMHFNAEAMSDADFRSWVSKAKTETRSLNQETYASLRLPAVAEGPRTYGTVDPELYGSIIAKYMNHSSDNDAPQDHMTGMEGMHHGN